MRKTIFLRNDSFGTEDEKSKPWVATLKLQGIDGRTPPKPRKSGYSSTFSQGWIQQEQVDNLFTFILQGH